MRVEPPAGRAVFTRWYLPGYQAGGPIRTPSNMVDRLGDDLDFRIVTQDRDVSDRVAYPGIDATGWNPLGHSHVRYLSRQLITCAHWPGSSARSRRMCCTSTVSSIHCSPSACCCCEGWAGLRTFRWCLRPVESFRQGRLRSRAGRRASTCVQAVGWVCTTGWTWQASSDLEKQDILRCLPRSTAPASSWR